MALKSDRTHISSRIDFFMNEAAERGGCVVVSTAGSGAAMDQAVQLCTYAANPSGVKPLGILMCDMVNLDLTRQKENVHKEEVQQGGKVTIWQQGEVLTNRILTGHTPTTGSPAFVAHSGWIATTDVASDAVSTNNRHIGTWMSSKDEDGYAKLAVNLPQTF